MTDPLRQRAVYLERFAKFNRTLAEGCAAGGIDHRFIDTAMPIEESLRNYLLYRRERAR